MYNTKEFDKKTNKKSIQKTTCPIIFLFAVLFLIVAGCTPDPFFVPVVFIDGVPETGTAGIPLTLTGTVSPAFANNNKIVWFVDDAGTTGASLDGNILYTGAEGTVTISARVANGIAEGIDYTQDFIIIFSKGGGNVPVTGVTLSSSSLIMSVGDTANLIPDIIPVDATNKTVTWASDNTSVATVTNGTVTAVAVGTATITVTTADGGKTATCVITVQAAAVNEARIGSTEFDTLTNAISTAANGLLGAPTEIVILKNITAVKNDTNDYAYSIPASKHIKLTVDSGLNRTITASAGNFKLFSLTNLSSSLTLEGNGTGILTLNGGNETAATNRQGVYVMGDPRFYLNSGVTITGFNSTGTGGGVYANGGFYMNGGEISGNTALNGGGVYHAGGGSYMSGGEILGNTATTNGGGVYVGGGTFTMTGGTIGGTTTDKNSATNGGGVFVNNSGTFTMTGGKISCNTATTNGGGVNNTNGNFNMNGGEISGNSATANGGGVYNNFKFNMSGGEISGNATTSTAINTGYGGGVYATSDSCEFTMSGGEIKGNTATSGSTSSGGGVYLNSGKFDMSGTSKIKGNTANRGGGVFVNSGTFEMKGGEISSDNNTINSGGGVYMNGGTFNMSGGEISGNTTGSTGSGGGVYVGNAIFNMSSGTIGGTDTGSKNRASNGGGVYVADGTFNMSGSSIISGNTATTGGGGVYNNKTFTMSGGTIGGTVTGSDNSAGSGGGVYNSLNFEMTGGKILFNTATSGYGGGVNNGGTFTMSNGEISGNKTTSGGGGVYNSKTFELKGGKILSNTANNGGGVYVTTAGSNFTISSGEISGNTATTNGGGVYVGASGAFTMSGGYVYGTDGSTYPTPGTPNTATSGSASIYVAGTANYSGVSYGTGSITTTDNTLPLIKYTVTFNKNHSDTSGYADANPTTKSVTPPTTNIDTLPTAPTRTGYTFNGWYDTSAETGGTQFIVSTNVTANITVYARWTANTLSISYAPGTSGTGSAPTSPISANYGTNVTMPVCTYTRTGYTFAGWAVSGTGSISGTHAAGVSKSVAELSTGINTDNASITLTATWTITTYTVTFDKNNNDTGSTEPNPTSRTANYNTTVALPTTNPTRTGYTFANWYNTSNTTDGTQFTAATAVTADITVYARWTANTLSISYAPGTGATGSAPTSPTSATYGTSVTMPNNTYTRTGYTFAGWAVSGTGSTSGTHAAGVSKSVAELSTGINTGNASITLTATWTINTYTVTFSKNTTDAGSTDPSPTTRTADYNTTVALPTTNPTRTGYIFNGWNTATGGGGTAFTATTSVTGNITVYAQWIQAAARIGAATMGYRATLKDAIADAANGDTITILKNISTADTGESSSGYTISNKSLTITVANGSNYTITAGAGGFALFTNDTPSYRLTLGQSSGGGTLTLSGGAVTATTNRRGVYNKGYLKIYSNVTISNFNNNTTTSGNYGGGVYTEGNALEMEGGTIQNCSAYNGGGVYIHSGASYMNSGNITSNTGGGVYMDGGSFTMYGGTISNNTNGYGLYMAAATTRYYANVGGTISDNASGGVYLVGNNNLSTSPSFTLNLSGTISGNSGSGVSVYKGAYFVMSDTSVIDNNTKSGNGGGVYVEDAYFDMGMSSGDSCIIKNNKATNGGGVYITGTSSEFWMVKGTIYGSSAGTGLANTASSGTAGGASLFVNSGSAKYENNSANIITSGNYSNANITR